MASGAAGGPMVASLWPKGGGKWLEISKYSSKKEGVVYGGGKRERVSLNIL